MNKMKLYNNYQEIKNEHKKNAYDIFTNYIMDVITLDERKEVRKLWNNTKNNIDWNDYLINYVNFYKVGLNAMDELRSSFKKLEL